MASKIKYVPVNYQSVYDFADEFASNHNASYTVIEADSRLDHIEFRMPDDDIWSARIHADIREISYDPLLTGMYVAGEVAGSTVTEVYLPSLASNPFEVYYLIHLNTDFDKSWKVVRLSDAM